MKKITGLVIRGFGGKYVVCDGVEKSTPEAYGIGQTFSPWFDTHEEAVEWRRRLYNVISIELQAMADKTGEDAYGTASQYLNIKYDIKEA